MTHEIWNGFLRSWYGAHDGSWTKSPRSWIRSIIPCFHFTNTATWATENNDILPQNDIIFRDCNIQVTSWLAQIRFSSSLAFVSLNPIFTLLDRDIDVTSFCSSKVTRLELYIQLPLLSVSLEIHPGRNTKQTKICLLPPQQQNLPRDQHKKHLQQKKKDFHKTSETHPKTSKLIL